MSILNQEFTRNLGLVDNYASYPPVNKHNSNRTNNNFGNFQRQSHGDQTPLSSTPPSLASGYRAPSSSPLFLITLFKPFVTWPRFRPRCWRDNNRGGSTFVQSSQNSNKMFYQQHRQEQQGGIAYPSGQPQRKYPWKQHLEQRQQHGVGRCRYLCERDRERQFLWW